MDGLGGRCHLIATAVPAHRIRWALAQVALLLVVRSVAVNGEAQVEPSCSYGGQTFEVGVVNSPILLDCNTGVAFGGPLSVAFTIKYAGVGLSRIVDFPAGDSSAISIGITPSSGDNVSEDKLYFQMTTLENGVQYATTLYGTAALDRSVSARYLATLDGFGAMTLYKDGSLYGTATGHGKAPIVTRDVYIGNTPNDGLCRRFSCQYYGDLYNVLIWFEVVDWASALVATTTVSTTSTTSTSTSSTSTRSTSTTSSSTRTTTSTSTGTVSSLTTSTSSATSTTSVSVTSSSTSSTTTTSSSTSSTTTSSSLSTTSSSTKSATTSSTVSTTSSSSSSSSVTWTVSTSSSSTTSMSTSTVTVGPTTSSTTGSSTTSTTSTSSATTTTSTSVTSSSSSTSVTSSASSTTTSSTDTTSTSSTSSSTNTITATSSSSSTTSASSTVTASTSTTSQTKTSSTSSTSTSTASTSRTTEEQTTTSTTSSSCTCSSEGTATSLATFTTSATTATATAATTFTATEAVAASPSSTTTSTASASSTGTTSMIPVTTPTSMTTTTTLKEAAAVTSSTSSTTTSIGNTTSATSTATSSGTSTVSSTTETSTTETATTATGCPTTVTTTTSFVDLATIGSAGAADVAQAAASDGAKQITSLGLVSFEKETSLGRQKIVSLADLNVEGGIVTVPSDSGTKVVLQASLLESLPPGSILVVLNMDGSSKSGAAEPELFQEVSGDSGAKAVTKPLDITVCGSDADCPSVTLPEPMLFKLPGSDGASADATCAFLSKDGNELKWSTEGVWKATDAEVLANGQELGGVWCWTEHLSIFSAILDQILACTNLEMLTEDAMRGIVNHEGWWRQKGAVGVFFMCSLLLAAFILGIAWECRGLRLGRTTLKSKPVSICKSFMAWGPQVVKHRYTALLVYGKDLFHCATAGRTKLKNSTLTSAVQRFLAVRNGISVAAVTAHCWNGNGWVETQTSMPLTMLCSKLEFHSGTAAKVVEEELQTHGARHFIQRFLETFLAVHPLLDAMRLGVGSMTAAKRLILQAAGIMGVIATNAMIFNFTGDFRSFEAEVTCFIPATSQLFVIVASVVSIMINAIPNAFLTDLAKQVWGRPGWTLLFWVLSVSYLGFAALFVTITLANLNEKDQGKWYKALEWGMAIKLLAMPTAQGIRHNIMLHGFLWEDWRCEPSKQFRAVVGLRHPAESDLTKNDKEIASDIARRSISAEELIKFTAMLGDKVMFDFVPAASTSEQVLEQAIRPLCNDVAAPEETPFNVTIVAMRCSSSDHLPRLCCSVLHLSQQVKQERQVFHQIRSKTVAPETRPNGELAYSWDLSVVLPGVQPDEAIAFSVEEEDTLRSVGIAWIAAETLLRDVGFEGELRLELPERAVIHELGPDGKTSLRLPAVDAIVPIRSPGRGGTGNSTLHVRVSLDTECLRALAVRSRSQMRDLQHMQLSDMDTEETPQDHKERLLLFKLETDTRLMTPSDKACKAFCEPILSAGETPNFNDANLPAERMVVHSRKGIFTHMVSAVLTEALHSVVGVLGRDEVYDMVHTMVLQKDFAGLLDMLREEGRQHRRYWIDLFAVPPVELDRGVDKEFLTPLPAILRCLRRDTCYRMISEIKATGQAKTERVQQMIVQDKRYHMMRESSCLAEVMLARSMRIPQHLLLHPSHLQGAGLGEELTALAEELQAADNANELPWTSPFLENRQAVYDAIRELTIASVKEVKEDNERTWQELSMTNLIATLGAVQVTASGRMSGAAGGDGEATDFAQTDDVDFGGD